jgi:hypothetical protein
MAIQYKVYSGADSFVALDAAKVNTGENRLWFFDEENNLIGLFKWDNILGFTLEGSAKDQVITGKIPLEMGKVPENELGVSGRSHLESIRQQLERPSYLDLPI